MKKLFVFLMTVFAINLAAQDNYLYPEFVQAQVYYKNSAITALLNYNLFTSDMLVLDGKSKKRIPDLERIEYISIDRDRFVRLHENTYGKIVTDGNLVLAIKYSATVAKTDESTKGLSKTAVNKLLDSGKPLPEGIYLTVDSSYYLVKQRKASTMFYLPGANVEKANYTGIIKLFLKHKSEIDAFIKEKNIDFSSVESLTALVQYCEQFVVE